MSASLVGSEMCIRDRAPNARAEAPSARAGISAAPLGWGWGQTVTFSVPVSYTHLTLPTICSV
eukprot:10937187-Alexandrium_andersonii.AAC.1